MSNETNHVHKNNFFSKTKSIIQQATNNVNAANVSVNVNSLQDSLHSITGGLLRPKFNLPDRAVASQVLMYRQLLHTECKPGLRLSRDYQGTDAQKKVMHMPWWEQGVETSKKMVISYDNLIVRLWLAGAIMPFVDGGYAEQHSNVTVLKDDVPSESKTTLGEKGNIDEEESHIDTLIDSKGLPPIPHPYWVDRLGFQQTDPVTDFRSGGVLSLARLCHIVEACPHVHERFLPSGDTHMLPFGITCINITDMIAKFCMFSKSVDKMDALLSQKPFWKMFENPDSLLVLQELSMETLCNVVVELKKERQMTEFDETSKQKNSMQHTAPGDVTVFDFSEILKRTEKRVNDDLLGSGPRTVDELRMIHSKNHIRYLKAMEQREKAYEKKVTQKQPKEPFVQTTPNYTEAVFGKQMSESVNAIAEPVKSMTGNVIGTTTGMLSKIKDFGLRPLHNTSNHNGKGETIVIPRTQNVEEIHFDDDDIDIDFAKVSISECNPSVAPSATVPTESSALIEANDILTFLNDDDLHTETERAKQQFANLLDDTEHNTSSVDLFTIDDDDDFLNLSS